MGGPTDYYGQLLLQKSNLTGTEPIFSLLGEICVFSFEEFKGLKVSIQ